MPRTLKVFRTPIGFHDAYVAAPSQKAALKAWGSDANLFARGAADVVTDPALTKEPLANPGKIIRLARGSAAEHLAALPLRPVKLESPDEPPPAPKRSAKPKPRPGRTRVDALERKIAATQGQHEAEEAELRRRERELADERHRLARSFERRMVELDAALEEAKTRYGEAMDRWREEG